MQLTTSIKSRADNNTVHGLTSAPSRQIKPALSQGFAMPERYIVHESPVMSVIEGTGFHPLVVPVCRDGAYIVRGGLADPVRHACYTGMIS
jgi:hypothetical protein